MSKSTPIAQISQMPNQQPLPDAVIADADATIQEALNQLGSSEPLAVQPVPPQQYNPNVDVPVQQMYAMPQQQVPQPMYASPDPGSMYAPTQMQPEDLVKNRIFEELANWNQDIKLICIVFAVTIFIMMLPIEKLVYNYIALDKIPYSEVVIKAIVASMLFFVLKRVI